MKKRSFLNKAVIGFILGIAELIPVLSGSMIAYILGIYHDLINSINTLWGVKSSLKNRLKSLKFLGVIIIFSFIGMVTMSKIIEFALVNFYAYFMIIILGLIIPGLFHTFSEINQKEINISKTLIAVLGFAILLIFVQVGSDEAASVITSTSQLPNLIFFFLVGILVGFVMILPGFSSSLFMIVIGFYSYFVYILANLEIVYLIATGLGIGLGVILFAKFVGFLVKKYQIYFQMFITGLIIGSIIIIGSEISSSFSGNIIISILIFIVTLAVGFYINYLSAKRGKKIK